MSVEELLRPRVICIGTGDKHYPGSSFEVGEILILGPYADGKEKYGLFDGEGFPVILLLKKVVDNYPHLFKKLEWHEERKKSDLPEYVKISEFPHKGEFTVIHVDGINAEHSFSNSRYFGISYLNGGGTYIGEGKPNFLPATKEEYLAQNEKS